jgi:hypothetical protein
VEGPLNSQLDGILGGGYPLAIFTSFYLGQRCDPYAFFMRKWIVWMKLYTWDFPSVNDTD